MKLIRLLRRSLLLLGHVLYGIFLNLLAPRIQLHSGESLPDPEVVSNWLGRLCRILDLQILVAGSAPHSRCMLVANHISWMDVPVLGSITHTGFLAKYGVRRWPVIGWLAASAGSVFIRRGKGEAQQVAEVIANRLEGDRQLTIFPEGTTSDGSQVRNFFPRLFSAAISTDTPIVPVALYYEMNGQRDPLAPFIDSQHILLNLLRILCRETSQVRVTFCEPLQPKNRDRRSLAEDSRQAIVDKLPIHPRQAD